MQDLPLVAIPSYKRVSILAHKTLKLLIGVGYPAEKITVFVADDEEAKEYRKMLNAIKPQINLVVGKPGLQPQREFISNYYPENTILLCMDDDVDNIKTLDPEMGFLGVVRAGANLLETTPFGLFGVLPNDDARRFKNATTTHLTHILGSFFICRNNRDCVPELTEKEDYERSILYFRCYGCVFRYQGAGVATKYNIQSGGLYCPDRKSKMAAECVELRRRFPRAVKIITKKDHPDISLNWRCSVDETNSCFRE